MVKENSLSGKLIIICGPTGSGKSALAVELAKLLDTEIISADSVAVYRNLNIGAAKPTKEEMQGVKHHLIDVCGDFDEFTVSDYESLAIPVINELLSRGKTPIVCGGTGYYINSILYKMSYGNAKANPEIRKKYADLEAKYGKEYVYSILKEKDPASCIDIHPNDVMRTVRALEILEVSGVKKSDVKDEKTVRYPYYAFSYEFVREELYKRINARVDKMFDNGLIAEVKGLINSGVTAENQCMQGIGYKEVAAFLGGDNSDPLETVKMNSRRYSKRQLTFFKRLEGLNFLQGGNNPYGDAIKIIEGISGGLYKCVTPTK